MTHAEMERARKLATEMLMERLADDALDLDEFEVRLDQVNAALDEVAGTDNYEVQRVETVGPTASSDLFRKAMAPNKTMCS